MIARYGAVFYALSRIINLYRLDLETRDNKYLEEAQRLVKEIPPLPYFEMSDIGLTLTDITVKRLVEVTDALDYKQLEDTLKELDGRFKDELNSVWFKHLSKYQAYLYNSKQLFGEQVEAKCNRASSDIQEAGKCLALERPTATVFHLMRVMETGVQLFGEKLGITLVEEKVWQVILDQINKAIKGLPDRTIDEKEKKNLYAEAAAHLFNVKLAWRNEVMHPKATYTPEEAYDVFAQVKKFMEHLAGKILS